MKRWIAFLLAAVLAVSMTACRKNETSYSEKFDIVVVPKAEADPWYVQMEQGVLEYAKAHPEVNVYTQSIEKYDALKQSQLAEDLVAQRVDAICVVPMDAQMMDPMLEKAREVGIAVITCNGADLMHVDYDLEAAANADPAAAVQAMIALACKVLQNETVSVPLDLGVPGYEALTFREGSETVLERAD